MATLNEQNSYDVIGTASTAATLTTAYTGNRTSAIHAKYMPNLHLDIQYTPAEGQTNRFAYILIEASNDNGTTYFPIVAKSTGTTEIDLFIDDTDGNAGIPMIFPGDKTSTGAVVYRGAAEATVVAELLRISAKESGAGNFGTIYVRATLKS